MTRLVRCGEAQGAFDEGLLVRIGWPQVEAKVRGSRTIRRERHFVNLGFEDELARTLENYLGPRTVNRDRIRTINRSPVVPVRLGAFLHLRWQQSASKGVIFEPILDGEERRAPVEGITIGVSVVTVR